MKKTLTLFLFFCLFFVAQATESRTVNTTAGQLSTNASAYLTTVTDLTITGTIDARDFKTMRDAMPLLAVLDLSGATIAEYIGTTGTVGTTSITYPANEIPRSAFCYSNTGKISLKSIIMPSSITSIGSFAFSLCSGLTGPLIIPSLVRSIGDYAFQYCSRFTGSLTIPSSVTSIGSGAFNYCCSFTGSLIIPSSVTSIGDVAFSQCSGLTGSLTLPSSVTSIGDHTFSRCSGFTGSLIIPSSVTSIGSSAFYGCSSFIGSLTIPSLVTSIGSSAFSGCSGFTGSLTIPSLITSIGASAFNGCSGFVGSLTLPSSVISIGSSAFSGCSGFTGSLTIPSLVTSIGASAFYNCTKISSINAYGTTPDLITLGSTVFSGMSTSTCKLYVPPCSKALYAAADQWKDFLQIIESPVNVTTPGTLGTLLTTAQLNAVTNLTITGTIDARDFKTMRDDMPLLATLDLSGVTIAAYTGTDGTGETTNITYPANEISQNAFCTTAYKGKTSLTSVAMPTTTTSIGTLAFCGCSGLTGSLSIPSSVTYIGVGAFLSCSGLTEMNIPNNVTAIDENAFSYCSGLQSLTLSSSLITIGGYAFRGLRKLTTLTIPPSVQTIGSDAFSDNNTIVQINVPASVTSISVSAFSSCSALITVDAANPNYSSVDGVLFNKDKTVLLSCPSSIVHYVIPPSVTTIGDLAFFRNEKLLSVSIPSSVTTISNEAFSGSINLNSIKVYGVTPSSIALGSNVFFQIPTSTCTLHVPVGTKDAYAAADQWKDFMPNIVADLVIAPAATTMAASSITCSGAILNASINAYSASTAVTFEYGLTSSYGTTVTAAQSPVTGSSATAVSYALVDLTPSTTYHYRVIGVNSEATTNGGDMTFSTLSNSVISVSVPTVGGLSAAITATCSTLSGVTDLTVTGTIDARDFKTMRDDMPLLAKLNLSGVTIAPYSGVDGPNNGPNDDGVSYTYPQNTIPYNAFSYYKSGSSSGKTTLTSITLPSSLTSICNYAFYGCTGLTGSLVIPDGVTSIGDDAFKGCTGLTGSLTFPAGLTSIGNSAFGECIGFTGSLILPASLTSIGENAFLSCSGFTGSLVIPTGVTSIGNGAFWYCNGFTGSLTLPAGLTSIGENVFFSCSGFTGSLTLPAGLASIGKAAFSGCSGFTGSLNLPASLSYISDRAFIFCFGFEFINVSSVSPIALGVSVFSGTPIKSIKLTVPDGSYQAYSTADQWKDFFAVNVPSPTTLTGFITHTGNASASQTFTIGVSATMLDLTVTAPAGYEVRENGIGTFGSTVAFTSATGSIADKTIEVRMASSAVPGVISGNVVCFSTGTVSQNVAVSGTVSDVSIITTQAVNSITATTATANGTIVDLGISNPTAYGMCWNTTGNPTVADHIANNGAAFVTSAFTAALTGLASNTTYYVKAFSTNSAGTSYGAQLSFTTTNIAPAISYTSSQTYALGTPIAALTPANAGGAVVPMLSPQVSTFAGSGDEGSADGSGVSASFSYPSFLTTDAAGNIYLSDAGNDMIRKITPTGNVSTLVDASAGFSRPAGIALDQTGNLYVVDNQNHRILKITPAGVVSTLAGSDSGEFGNDNGNGTAARFQNPIGLALDAAGNLYVADRGNNMIRKITQAGDVSTLAGSGTEGSDNGNGTSASFSNPFDLKVDASGNVYVNDMGNGLIRKITPTGDVSTFCKAGSSAPAMSTGIMKTPIGSTLNGIAIDGVSGNFYVTDVAQNLIRRITCAGVVSTLAGSGDYGATDGPGEAATFASPTGITVDAAGNIYVADADNNLIRKITQASYTISPALPAGLSFDGGATGVISGTPTAASAATAYTVTAANNGGSSTTTISIAVKNSQTITFGTLLSKTYGDNTFGLAATSTSGLPVSYSSDNTAVARVLGSTVTIMGAGTANITASQTGDATYAAATNVTQQLTVSKKALTVTAATDTKTYDGTTTSTVVPTVGTLATGDAINVAPTQVFDNANVGTTHVLTASGLTIKRVVWDNAPAFDKASVETIYKMRNPDMDVTGNYEISYIPATGTINKKAVTVTATADTKTYDGTTVSTAVPTVGTLATSDAINAAPTQAFDNATVGTTHVLTASGLTIKNGSTDATGNYDISYATATGTINKKALTITDPTVITSKTVDGNTTAVVSSSGTLQNVLTGDLNNVIVTATANYDNATVGTNKTITVVYTLSGSAANNYTAPVNFVITDAKIVDVSSGVDAPTVSDAEAVTACPTQVAMGQSCVVKVSGFTDSDLQGTTLSVYNTQGVCVYHSAKVGLTNSIALPSVQGMYLGRATTAKGKEFQFKVIVTR